MSVSGETDIKNKYGFHARPSTSFAQMAGGFSSDITVEANGMSVDGKSIMALMSLGAPQGTHISVTACGDDEADALQALLDHVNDRFGGIE